MIRAAAIVVALCSVATASPWKAGRGTLEPGRAPSSYILTSDSAPGRYSEGSMISVEPVALPYTITAIWRRLGPEPGRSMHVHVAGGVVLIKQGAIAFYAYDDAAFAQGDWRPLPGHNANAEHMITVHQDKQGISVKLDGVEAVHYDLPVTRDTTHVGFGMKSAPGYRSAIYLRDVNVDHSTD
jgi:hypothetical protein